MNTVGISSNALFGNSANNLLEPFSRCKIEVDRKWKFHFFPLSAVTESRPKVTCHIRPKPYVPPKVKRDFRPKTETETESQSYLSRHDYRSQQVPPSVRCPTIPCIWYISHLAPSRQPCGVSLNDTATRPHSTRCRRRQRSRFLGIVSTQWG